LSRRVKQKQEQELNKENAGGARGPGESKSLSQVSNLRSVRWMPNRLDEKIEKDQQGPEDKERRGVDVPATRDAA
jgi:hypothetical protein